MRREWAGQQWYSARILDRRVLQCRIERFGATHEKRRVAVWQINSAYSPSTVSPWLVNHTCSCGRRSLFADSRLSPDDTHDTRSNARELTVTTAYFSTPSTLNLTMSSGYTDEPPEASTAIAEAISEILPVCSAGTGVSRGRRKALEDLRLDVTLHEDLVYGEQCRVSTRERGSELDKGVVPRSRCEHTDYLGRASEV